jgi:hypothetical protein
LFPVIRRETIAADGVDPHIARMTDRMRDRDGQAPASPQKKVRPGADAPREIGGPKGPEPTRYGDWEHNGRCTDF